MKATSSYLRALLPIAALSFASLLKADTVRTLKADGSQNNANIYSARQDVWIGVQDGTSFEKDGIYFFGVTIPSSSAATSLLANDGAANTELPYTTQTIGNGNSAYTTAIAPQWSGNATDPWGWLSRVMIVTGGKIAGATSLLGSPSAHQVQDDPRNNGGKIVQLWPYAPSANNEYKIWMVHISQVTVVYKIGANGAAQTTSAENFAGSVLPNNPGTILLQATYPNSKGTSTDNFKVIVQSTNGPTLQLVCPSSQNLAVCPGSLGAYATLGNASASGLGQGGTFVLDSIAFTNTNGGAPVTVPQNNGQYFFPVGSTTVTISGHDSSAPTSTASCSFFVVVEAVDVDAPVPNVANLDVSGQCSVTVTAPKATDACVGQVTGTTTDPLTYTQQGIYIVHWSYNDGHGNISTQNQTVTVKDDIKPVPTLESLPDATGVCSVTLVAPTATDNCLGLIDGTTGTMTFTGETDTVVTWTYNDTHGNIVTQTQHVVVHDGEAPAITAPANITVNTDLNSCSAVVNFEWNATDNCTLKSKSIDIPSGSTFPKGTTTVTINAEDAAGNKSTKTFTVTVVDNQAPTITAPANITLNTLPGTCAAIATYEWSASDNCAVKTSSIDIPSGSSFPKGTTTVTINAEDTSGNKSSKTFTVTVVDNEAPVITSPLNFTVNTDAGNCSAVVNFDWSASDNCALKSSSVSIPSGSAFPKGTTTVTINAEDTSGNKSSKTFSVTVIDNQAPIVPTLATITGECSATALAPTTTDNCDGTVTGTTTGATTFTGEGTYTIVWTFTDAAGNSSQASQTVIVTDKTAKISGVVFNDHNTVNNGVQDAGDPGLAGWTVTLKQGATIIATATTAADGSYSFPGLHSGTYTVVETVKTGWFNTTPTSVTVTVGCGGASVASFGDYSLGAGGALSKGFWTSKNGQAVFQSNGPTTGTVNLAKLATYSLRDSKGLLVNLTSYSAVSTFLSGATATNMVNMLSAQLAAVVLDIQSGNQTAGAQFGLNCNGSKVVSVGSTAAALAAFPTGFATVDEVVAKAQALLLANNPADVATQTAVKDILDGICNNKNFVQ